MRHALSRGWILLPLCTFALGSPAEAHASEPQPKVLKAPAPPAPPLPEAPSMVITPATSKADRVLPGPCRQRRVEGMGQPGREVQVRRVRYDGDRPTEIEALDASGGFLWRAEPKLDAQGRVVEVVERASDRKPLATHAYVRDAEGRVVRETYARAKEKKPSFERTVTYDEAGKVTGETWRWGTTTWKLAPALDRTGAVETLTREDGKLAMRHVRDREGNPLMEYRFLPDGSETRLVHEYGCFGFDETAAARLGDLCKDDVDACVRLAKLLSEDAYALGMAPDPALSEVYRIHACRKGHAPSCLKVAEKDRDPERVAGFRHHARILSIADCKEGDGKACERACQLGDSPSCRHVAADGP